MEMGPTAEQRDKGLGKGEANINDRLSAPAIVVAIVVASVAGKKLMFFQGAMRTFNVEDLLCCGLIELVANLKRTYEELVEGNTKL
ncbi:hypothetical protein BHE74_00043603 [Ensete ventricosum]|nr:hypothetical protein GW17_00056534 [Ensete ventricosum]RWW50163.1 hypothetical protein BHE74_00043603 [Ensete ventricosum]RZS19771.1 hypothetical protein BHM03_00052214 [Ensete ventricosum]